MAETRKDDMAQDQLAPENSGTDEIEDYIGSDELEALRAERDEMRDRFMRALADAENARKRGERDRREAEQYGGSKLARDLLPVYDNLQRALDAATEDQRAVAKALIEGVELTMRELQNVLTKHGVTRIQPQIGEAFDPQHHQAMFEAPLPGTKVGQIIQVMTEGFLLHDRLLRPAQVGVSSTAGGPNATGGGYLPPPALRPAPPRIFVPRRKVGRDSMFAEVFQLVNQP